MEKASCVLLGFEAQAFGPETARHAQRCQEEDYASLHPKYEPSNRATPCTQKHKPRLLGAPNPTRLDSSAFLLQQIGLDTCIIFQPCTREIARTTSRIWLRMLSSSGCSVSGKQPDTTHDAGG